MSDETLYLKLDKNMQIKTDKVMLGDIAQIICSTNSVENKVKTLKLPTEQIKGPGRYVFSVVDVIKVIHTEYPKLQVNNIGESDFILTVEKEKTHGNIENWLKTAFVCLLAFLAFTGEKTSGFTLLEISYSIGVGTGILIFFHHFARKRNISDPTPLEVEMRTYEDEVDTTVIESSGRSAKKTG